MDIRAWSTETQTNIASFLYSGVWTHSAPLFSLYTLWKYLKLSFFDVFREYRKRHEVVLRTFKSSCTQMFFRLGVLFLNIQRKTTEFESLFDKVTGLQSCSFIKKRLQFRYYFLNIAKFLRTALFIEHFRWLVFDPVSHLRLNFFYANN